MQAVFLSHNARQGDAIGNQLAGKVRFLRAQGWGVQVYLQDANGLHAELKDLAVQHSARSLWRDRLARQALVSADLVSAEYGSHYDLLHLLPALCGRGPRIVIDYRGVTPRALWPAEDARRLIEAERGRSIVWCADLTLVQSEAMARELHHATGYPQARIRQLSCWVDTTWFALGPVDLGLREQIDAREAFVLLYVGRLAANKRPGMLVEALPRLHDLGRPVHAVFVGDATDIYASQGAACRQRARELDVQDRVHLLGHVDDVELRAWYHTADVLVLPSLHEGFCIPAVEAMACGLPVIAARAAALPGTLGDAGLTFAADDVGELARAVLRVARPESSKGVPNCLTPTRPSHPCSGRATRTVALVAPRFGSGFVGGAEHSLALIARALQQQGREVEVFTTCTKHESDWTNELPGGTQREDGLLVHRFRVDRHDRGQHLAALDAIRANQGQVDERVEGQYLNNSLRSDELIAELTSRQHELEAILVGPYLFGLTWQVARAFGDKVLLVPCFHDEPLVHLRAFRQAYQNVGGMLYHSPEEKHFAEAELGLNHPNANVIGTVAHVPEIEPGNSTSPRTLVYCGRYSVEKGVDRLLEFFERYAASHPQRFRLAMMGQGGLPLPQTPWLVNLGFVSEDRKQRELSKADALIQLSTSESLSLVALEAWALGVPVIVHHDCRVLREQVRRANGGVAIADYEQFAAGLDSLWHEPERWRQHGRSGRDYVQQHYASMNQFANRIQAAIANLHMPLAELLRANGLQRAEQFSVPAWERRLAALLEELLEQREPERQLACALQPQGERKAVSLGQDTVLIPVRLTNRGTLPLASAGPARVHLGYVIRDDAGRQLRRRQRAVTLTELLPPGVSRIVVIPVTPPTAPGCYRVRFRASSAGLGRVRQTSGALLLDVQAGPVDGQDSPAAPFLEGAQAALAQAHELRHLPDDYRDVTQGFLAPWKQAAKRKLLHQFRRSYVDVLSRQQSAFNEQILLGMCQVIDAVSASGQAHAGPTLRREFRRMMKRAERRLARMESRLTRLERILSPSPPLGERG